MTMKPRARKAPKRKPRKEAPSLAVWGQVYRFPHAGFVCIGPVDGYGGEVYSDREAAELARSGDRRVFEVAAP